MTAPGTLTALEIAKIACDIENDGIRFYGAAAAATGDGLARSVFMDLTQQERDHLSTFRSMYDRFDEESGGGESSAEMLFDDELTKYLRAVTEGLVFPTDEDARTWVREQPDAGSIIRFALDAEKSSILFYSAIVDQNAFAASRDILRKIIEEERSHVVVLRDLMLKLA